jgi:hypothetical protein
MCSWLFVGGSVSDTLAKTFAGRCSGVLPPESENRSQEGKVADSDFTLFHVRLVLVIEE